MVNYIQDSITRHSIKQNRKIFLFFIFIFLNSSIIKFSQVNIFFEEVKENGFLINSEEKYKIILSLEDKISSYRLNKFFVLKEKGQSFIYHFIKIKRELTIFLNSSLFLFITEELIKKYTYSPRPYRSNIQLLLNLKLELSNKIPKIKHFTENSLYFYNIKTVKIWLLKKFPYKKNEIFQMMFKKLLPVKSKFFHNFSFLYYSLLTFNINGIQDILVNFPNNKKINCLNSFRFFKSKDTVYALGSDLNILKQNITLLEKFFLIRGIAIHKKKLIKLESNENEIVIENVKIIKKRPNLLIILPSKDFVTDYKITLKNIIKKCTNIKVLKIIELLNKEITLCKKNNRFLIMFVPIAKILDLYINRLLWKYVKRLHSRRTNSWIYNKYWKYIAGSWRFIYIKQETGKLEVLLSHKHLDKSTYVINIPNITNTFKMMDYKKINYINFLKIKYTLNGIRSLIFNRQKGVCYKCNFPLHDNKNKIINFKKKFFVLVHATCN